MLTLSFLSFLPNDNKTQLYGGIAYKDSPETLKRKIMKGGLAPLQTLKDTNKNVCSGIIDNNPKLENIHMIINSRVDK